MKKIFLFLISLAVLGGSISAQDLDRIYSFGKATVVYKYDITLDGDNIDNGKYTRYISDGGSQEAARQEGIAFNLQFVLGARSVTVVDVDEDDCQIVPIENARLVNIVRYAFLNAHKESVQKRLGYQATEERDVLGHTAQFYKFSKKGITAKGAIISKGKMAGVVTHADVTLPTGQGTFRATIEVYKINLGDGGSSDVYKKPSGISCG